MDLGQGCVNRIRVVLMGIMGAMGNLVMGTEPHRTTGVIFVTTTPTQFFFSHGHGEGGQHTDLMVIYKI